MRNIAIDLRMLTASGIGTYLQNLIPRIIDMPTGWKFSLMGRAAEINNFEWAKQPLVDVIDCQAPIYSLKEQYEIFFKIPRDTDVFWSPHYNIPLLYRGKLLVTIHDVIHLAREDLFSGFHKQLYAKIYV